MPTSKKTALITGASRGLGLAIAKALAERGWDLIINGRNAKALMEAQLALSQLTGVKAILGNVIDEIHLLQFPEMVRATGGLDLLVNNASTIGMSPQPALLDYPLEVIHNIFHTNVIAPLSLIQKLRDQLKPLAKIVNISSDAAVQAYPGWGGYGASKAALDHLSAILAKENPNWKVFAFDPGDMRTQMHQEAFPGEDITDRPLPEEIAVPAMLELIEKDLPGGRYVASEVLKNINRSPEVV